MQPRQCRRTTYSLCTNLLTTASYMHQLLQHSNEFELAMAYINSTIVALLTHSLTHHQHPVSPGRSCSNSLILIISPKQFSPTFGFAESVSAAMASSCSIKQAMAIVTLMCAVIFIADVQACSLQDLSPCLSAVTNGVAPTSGCCAKVAAVDVTCFCNLVSGQSYPAKYVSNAVSVPAKCGGTAYAHFKGTTCAGHPIN